MHEYAYADDVGTSAVGGRRMAVLAGDPRRRHSERQAALADLPDAPPTPGDDGLHGLRRLAARPARASGAGDPRGRAPAGNALGSDQRGDRMGTANRRYIARGT